MLLIVLLLILAIIALNFGATKFLQNGTASASVTFNSLVIDEAEIIPEAAYRQTQAIGEIAATNPTSTGLKVYYKTGELGTWTEYEDGFYVQDNGKVYVRYQGEDQDGREYFGPITEKKIANIAVAGIKETRVIEGEEQDVLVTYKTLEQAIEACEENAGETATEIEILADINVDTVIAGTQTVLGEIPANKNIVIDLNGHTITSTAEIPEGAPEGTEIYALGNCGKLEIKDSGLPEENSILARPTNNVIEITATGAVIGQEISVSAIGEWLPELPETQQLFNLPTETESTGKIIASSQNTVYNYGNGEFTITSGTIENTNEEGIAVNNVENSVVQINGGNINSEGEGILLFDDSTISMTDGSVTAKKFSIRTYYDSTGNISISGGTIITIDNFQAIKHDGDGNVIIDELNGKSTYIRSVNHVIRNSSTGTVLVKKGTLVSVNQCGIYSLVTGIVEIGDGETQESMKNVNVENPKIIGKTQCVLSRNLKFYDGKIVCTSTGILFGVTNLTLPDGYGIQKTISMEEIRQGEDVTEVEAQVAILVPANYKEETSASEYVSYYGTLPNAMKNVQSGNTIKVMKNTEESETSTLNAGTEENAVTLDLNGHTINYVGETKIIENFGSLEIKDSGANGKITTATITNRSGMVINKYGANFKLVSGELESLDGAKTNIIITNGGKVEISGGKIKEASNDDSAIITAESAVDSVINITGGAINSDGYGICDLGTNSQIEMSNATIETTRQAIKLFAIGIGAEATVNSGNIKSTGESAIENCSSGTAYINGGTVISTTNSAVNNTSAGTIEINGDALVHGFVGVSNDGEGTVYVKGGTVTSGTDDIQAIQNNGNGTINVSGGNVISRNHAIRNAASGPIIVSGGKIISTEIFGIANWNGRTGTNGPITVSGNPIIKGGSRGISAGKATCTITGGTIVGTNAGAVGIFGGNLTVGSNSDEVSTSTPCIIGESYGIYADGATFNFYDGIIKGRLNAIVWSVDNTPTGYSVKNDVQAIGENNEYGVPAGTYKTAILSNQYTVTFNPNGGNVSPSNKTVTYGEAYGTLPTPTRVGYAFDGWYNSEEVECTSSSVVETANNHSLYAHWKDVAPPTNLVAERQYQIYPNVPYESTYDMSISDDGTVQIGYDPRIYYSGMSRYTNVKAVVIKFKTPLETNIGGECQIFHTNNNLHSEQESSWVNGVTAGTKEVRIDIPQNTYKYIRCDIGKGGNASYQLEGIYLVTEDTLWSDGNIRVKLTATDNESGIKEYQSYKNGAWTTEGLNTNDGEGLIEYTANINEDIRYRAIDNAGNISDEITSKIQIDLGKILINTESMYVTDGIVARYDGVNNVNGSHSLSTTTWSDISTDSDVKNGIVTDGKWGDNYLEFNGTSTWVNMGVINSNYQTIEATFSINVDQKGRAIIGNWEGRWRRNCNLWGIYIR